jgi:hypothetical protein
VSLRWVLVHLLEETARHAGHADILREPIDGSAGREPHPRAWCSALRRNWPTRLIGLPDDDASDSMDRCES